MKLKDIIGYAVFGVATVLALLLIAATCPDVSAQVFAWDGASKLSGTYLGKDALSDSVKVYQGDEYPLPLPSWPDTTAVPAGDDSTTVKSLANLDAIKGQKKLLFVYGNDHAAEDSTIWLDTFKPLFDNADSLFFFAYSADASDTPFAIEIWDELGAILWSSDTIELAGDTTWYRKSFPFTGFSSLEEHAVVYRVTTKEAADAIQIGQVYVKRN